MDVQLMLDHPEVRENAPLTLRSLLKITGADTGSTRTPLSLALVLDRSGSMSGDKLRYAREAAALLVRRLRPEDTVSVVAYDSRVETLVRGTRGEEHEEAIRKIEGLSSRDLTNLSGGWLEGRELVEATRVEHGVNRIILMTDGLANQGVTDPTVLCGLCRTAAGQGITTTTIGFGQDFNEDLLQAMADAGGGATYYIENPEQAPGIFEEEVEGLLSLAVQNVKVDVRPAGGAKLSAVRHAYPSAPEGDGVRVTLGDLYAREPRYLLVEFQLEPGAGETVDVATFEIRGDVLTPDGGIEQRLVRLPVRLEGDRVPKVDPEIRRVTTLLDASSARERAMELEGRGDAMGASQALSAAASFMEDAAPDDEDIVREARDLREMAEGVREKQAFAAEDVKYMKQQVYDNRRARLEAKKKYWRGE